MVSCTCQLLYLNLRSQTYLTTVHSAILTSNGSESLKAYYQDYGKTQCRDLIQQAKIMKKNLNVEEINLVLQIQFHCHLIHVFYRMPFGYPPKN